MLGRGLTDFHGMEVDPTSHYVYLPFVKPDTSNPDNGTLIIQSL